MKLVVILTLKKTEGPRATIEEVATNLVEQLDGTEIEVFVEDKDDPALFEIQGVEIKHEATQ